GYVTSFAFSPDGSKLVSASGESVQLWDTMSGSSLSIPRHHTGRVGSIAFSPNGLQMAMGYRDSSIWLWDAISGTPISVLTGHSCSVQHVVFSPDGLQLVSASYDGSVRLWNVVSHTSIILRDNLYEICDITFVDAQTLIVKSITGTFLLPLTSQPPHHLGSKSSTVPDPSSSLTIWSLHGRWITKQQFLGNHIRRICYIPPSYTCKTGAVGSPLQSHVAFGCTNGRVVLLNTQHCL
ncbi:hypothetical protein BS47DRAFT_1309418, partial [Hydnum rufescens UP504]